MAIEALRWARQSKNQRPIERCTVRGQPASCAMSFTRLAGVLPIYWRKACTSGRCTRSEPCISATVRSSPGSELVYHHRFATLTQARTAIFDYIEIFYNRTRLHSSLAYQNPDQF